MSELSRWENLSKAVTGVVGAALVTAVGAAVKHGVDSYSNEASQKTHQEDLRRANAHLKSMNFFDKIFNGKDYRYWKAERDRLSK